MKSKIIIIIAINLLFYTTTVSAQHSINDTSKREIPAQQTEIYKEIITADSLLFNAFNNCDTVTYKSFLPGNFEFYHDLGGVHYLDEEMQSMREMCARNSHIRRELIKKTLEVYKLGDYGALEIGVHNFYHTNPGQSEHLSGTYKFIQVWQNTNTGWKLSRVISYAHEKMNNN